MSSKLSHPRPAGAPRAARAFTMIELMVAMAIIAVLVAIAMPAFAAARRAAKRASTEAMISVLSTGLEQFKADSSFGGQYPPSAMQLVDNPHISNNRTQVGGASFLAWGLAGADLLGTPGFRDLNQNKGSDDANIKYDVIGGCTDDTGRNGLYALGSTNKPACPRSGPYVEISKVKTPKPKGAGFEIPVGNHPLLSSVCFLDAFDRPVLYYKANPTAPTIAAAGMKAPPYSTGSAELYSGGKGSYTPTGIYNLLDNGGFLDGANPGNGTIGGNITGSEFTQGANLGNGTNHFNQNTESTKSILGSPSFPVTDLTNNPMGSFIQHIGNPNVIATPTPHNANSYILLSAGADGVYGTLDDVANFPMSR